MIFCASCASRSPLDGEAVLLSLEDGAVDLKASTPFGFDYSVAAPNTTAASNSKTADFAVNLRFIFPEI
jgi:hypothetical protein